MQSTAMALFTLSVTALTPATCLPSPIGMAYLLAHHRLVFGEHWVRRDQASRLNCLNSNRLVNRFREQPAVRSSDLLVVPYNCSMRQSSHLNSSIEAMKKRFAICILSFAVGATCVGLSGCGGPPVDANASAGGVSPQEEDPDAYEKEQADLLKKAGR